MVVIKAKKIVKRANFDGLPKLSDFDIVEEELPQIKNGEVLVEAEFLSVDPYMRSRAANSPIGSTMIGGQVAK